MNEEPAILEGEAPGADDARLVELFDKLEYGQIDLLDQSAKRLIELSALLLGALLASVVLPEFFPPPYLAHPLAKALAAITLVLYLGAMGLAMRALEPRDYARYRHNLSEMRRELGKIVAVKAGSLRLAGIAFWLGSLALVSLILFIIFTA
jgi:hypothetical protein